MAPNSGVVSESFERLAEWYAGTAPLYHRLATAAAADPDILDTAAAAPAPRSPAVLLMSAVHYLLLDGADHPLRDYYPTVAADARAPGDGDPAAAFRDFCLERRGDLREIVAARLPQANVVRRSAVLRPAFGYVGREAGPEVAMIAVGAGAGLNMRWDRYRYDYGSERTAGDADAPVTVRSRVRGAGDRAVTAPVPAVAWRAGIDLSPLDVGDADDVRWLRACLWPEDRELHAMTDAAVRVARRDPPDIRAGDAVETLPSVVAEVPDGLPVCIVDTGTLYHCSPETRAAYREQIRRIGRDREIHWLSGYGAAADGPGLELRYGTVEDGSLTRTRLLTYASHGRWLRWDAEEDH